MDNKTPMILALLLTLGLSGCFDPEPVSETPVPEQSAVIAPLGLELDVPVHADMPTGITTAAASPSITRTEEVTPTRDIELRNVDGLSLRRAAMTRGVENREPTDATELFVSSDERLYAHMAVRNTSDDTRFLYVTFERPDGTTTGHVELEIPANVYRWRTWAYTRHAQMPGEWTTVVRDADDHLVAEIPFTVEPGL